MKKCKEQHHPYTLTTLEIAKAKQFHPPYSPKIYQLNVSFRG